MTTVSRVFQNVAKAEELVTRNEADFAGLGIRVPNPVRGILKNSTRR